MVLGYVHAKFRLSEMDLERRLGEGRLAQLAGPSDLSSDEFELRLGLLRTAQNEWARTTGPSRAALLAYAQGANDDIAAVRAAGDWPAVFTLTGTYPGAVDPGGQPGHPGRADPGTRLHDRPARRGLSWRGRSARPPPRTGSRCWRRTPRRPTTPGPYVKAPLTPVAPDAASSAPQGDSPPGPPPRVGAPRPPHPLRAGGGTPGRSDDEKAIAAAAASLLAQLSQLPANQIHQYPDSNAWAANGPAVQGGGALLGGDPHLPQTEPSVWYEVALSAPGYQVSGVGVPGLPGILLGHNANIAWSLTDTQNAATRYYAERVRGDSYYWDGAWRPMTVVHYTIPVRGGATVNLARGHHGARPDHERRSASGWPWTGWGTCRRTTWPRCSGSMRRPTERSSGPR